MTERGYAAIGLHQPKNSINVGSVLRAAACYDASLVVCGGSRNRYRKTPTDTTKAWRHIPMQLVDDLHWAIPYGCVPVAVDLVDDATPLHEFKHPERAFYVFGPEDGTLGESVLSWCARRVYVPTRYCMNLAACVNVVLYDRQAKALARASPS